MNLVIGENEGKILEFLSQHSEGATNASVRHSAEIPAGSVGTTLNRMYEKGWLVSRKIEMVNPTPIADKTTLWSLTPLGEKALDAWRVYFDQ
jgi:predicted transcriptional regulator